MVPSVPTASIFGAVSVVAAVALLIGITVRLVRAFRERGTSDRPAVQPLEQAQTVAVTVAVVGLAVNALVDTDVAAALLVVGVFVTLALGFVRWRRGERPFPTGL